MRFAPKKYVCSICGKGFRRTKQHFNHVQRNSCGKNRGTNKKQVQQITIEPELVSMKAEIIHSEPRTTQYFGREYNFNNIPSGMRHLRSGLPLPRISKYARAAI